MSLPLTGAGGGSEVTSGGGGGGATARSAVLMGFGLVVVNSGTIRRDANANGVMINSR